MERINLRLLNKMMRDANEIGRAENTINDTIYSGQYVAIELSNGSIVRLDKPIKIHSVDIVEEDGNGRWNFNQ